MNSVVVVVATDAAATVVVDVVVDDVVVVLAATATGIVVGNVRPPRMPVAIVGCGGREEGEVEGD